MGIIPQNFSSLGLTVSEELGNKHTNPHSIALEEGLFAFRVRYVNIAQSLRLLLYEFYKEKDVINDNAQSNKEFECIRTRHSHTIIMLPCSLLLCFAI